MPERGRVQFLCKGVTLCSRLDPFGTDCRQSCFGDKVDYLELKRFVPEKGLRFKANN